LTPTTGINFTLGGVVFFQTIQRPVDQIFPSDCDSTLLERPYADDHQGMQITPAGDYFRFLSI